MITLHNPQNSIVFSLDLASEIGDKEAMLLPKIAEWLETGIIHGAEDKRTGKKYTQLITYEIDGELWRCIDLQAVSDGGFGFMSISTISRKIASLVKQGLIKERTDLNKHPFDASKWYALDRDGINSLKSLYFSTSSPSNPQIPDKLYSHNENGGYHSENYNIDNDSLKDLKIQDSESIQKNIKECKEEKESNLTPPNQVNGFSSQAEIGKTLLTPEPLDTRPTSPDERIEFRNLLANIMGLNIHIQENKSLVNRMVDVLYPQYRLVELQEMNFYFTRVDWRYKAGTTHPTKHIVFDIIEKAQIWARDGYPIPDRNNGFIEDYSDLIET